MEKLLNVSSSPHVRNKITTQNLMFDVAIAMIPASVYGVWQFGMHALLVLIATVVSCVLSEYVYEKLMKKPITVSDGSAVVTGMILALNMPPGDPGVDPIPGRYLRDYRSKAAVRRTGTELYEPGSGSQMLPFNFLCRIYEQLLFRKAWL